MAVRVIYTQILLYLSNVWVQVGTTVAHTAAAYTHYMDMWRELSVWTTATNICDKDCNINRHTY